MQRYFLISIFYFLSIILMGCGGTPAKSTTPATPPPPSPEIEKAFEEAMVLVEKGEWKRVVKSLKPILPKAENKDQKAKIMFLVAEGYFHLAKYETAHKFYNLYLKTFPQTEQLNETVEREHQIGFKFLEGVKIKFLGIPFLPGKEKGLSIVRDMFKRFPYAPSSADYQLKLADYFYSHGQYTDAFLEYDYFIQAYHKHPGQPRAHFQQANCFLMEYQGAAYEGAMLIKAKKAFEKYLQKYPDDEWSEPARQKLTDIENKQAQRDYQTGYFYLQTGKKESARIYFDQLIKNYPETVWAKKANDLMEPEKR